MGVPPIVDEDSMSPSYLRQKSVFVLTVFRQRGLIRLSLTLASPDLHFDFLLQ